MYVGDVGRVWTWGSAGACDYPTIYLLGVCGMAGESESELCRGVMCAICYPFDMRPKHRFQFMDSTQRYQYIQSTYMCIHCTYMYSFVG